jgi:hypothetical protein
MTTATPIRPLLDEAAPAAPATAPVRTREAPPIDQPRYWVGALLTASVTGLVGVLALVVAHGVARVPVLFAADGRLTAVSALGYGLVVAAAALVAAAVYDAVLLTAPRPTLYFAWLAATLTALAVVLPFTAAVPLGAAVALAGANLLSGAVITCLLPMAGRDAVAR